MCVRFAGCLAFFFFFFFLFFLVSLCFLLFAYFVMFLFVVCDRHCGIHNGRTKTVGTGGWEDRTHIGDGILIKATVSWNFP